MSITKLAHKNLLIKALTEGLVKTADPMRRAWQSRRPGTTSPYAAKAQYDARQDAQREGRTTEHRATNPDLYKHIDDRNEKFRNFASTAASFLPWGGPLIWGARGLGWAMKARQAKKVFDGVKATRKAMSVAPNPAVANQLRNTAATQLGKAKRLRDQSRAIGLGPKAITKPINWRSPTSIVGGAARAPLRLANSFTAPAGKGKYMKYVTPALGAWMYGKDMAKVHKPNANFSWDMFGSQAKRSKVLGMKPIPNPPGSTSPIGATASGAATAAPKKLTPGLNPGVSPVVAPKKNPVKPVKPYGQQIRLKPRSSGAVPMPPRTQ